VIPVKATVTFDVELAPKEARALELLQRGNTTGKVARSMGMSLDKIEELLAGIKLDKPLDLVEATRDRRISWEFHNVAAIRKTA
jgi:hypothetical protein